MKREHDYACVCREREHSRDIDKLVRSAKVCWAAWIVFVCMVGAALVVVLEALT